ncbi:MAG TPA: cation-translocating P-type ATPase [Acidimicrobiales bacterium]|nr:cation-translocating P-type ATPase [Acidimicrobiales bacterium]
MSGQEVVLDIEGMTCVSCVNRLERVLAKQPGVSTARVSLPLRRAAVQCDEAGTTDVGALVAAVEAAGYRAAPHRSRISGDAEVRDLQRRLAAAVFFTLYVLVFSMLVDPHSGASMRAAWLFATPVQFYGGWPFLRGAWRGVSHRAHTMDTLVAAGSLAAYAYSVMAVLTHTQHAHFDTAAVIVTLILVGRVLEARARKVAGNAARLLLERQPSTATVLDGDREMTVDRSALAIGDRVVVRPGEQIAADGIVLTGTSAVDLSVLTGESVPEDVGPGDAVVGASINGQGRLVVELTCVGEETRLGQIVQLLERTQASKAPIQRLADRIASVAVPWILALAGAVFALRWLWSADLAHSLMFAAAVLLVACPCSLGLATPAAIMVGSGRAAELGILFKGGEVIEAARRIDAVLVDKTGTLTEGRMSVTTVVGAAAGEADVLRLAAAAEAGSEHPLAAAVLAAAGARHLPVPEATDHQAQVGAGITARVGSSVVRVGRPDGLPADLEARADGLAAEGLMVVAVWCDDVPLGLLGASDAVKDGAAEAIERIRKWNRTVALVSGDRRPAVEAAAREAGIDEVVSQVFPDGKVAEVRRLQAEGKRVAFVGDGVNDAPALAQADLGIALGTGTDIAIEAADVLIMGGDLGLVADGLELAGRTYWIIVQNLAWAFAYNSLMVPLAVVGRVSPLLAAGAMAGSSWTVVSNALRLQRFRPGRTRADEDDTPAPLPTEITDFLAGQAPPPPPADPDVRRRTLTTLGRLWAQPWEC